LTHTGNFAVHATEPDIQDVVHITDHRFEAP
jgi:hypothetical protein